mmetsp:Transcript_22431/g.57083  ORF Transcript_22431/g.57083 Transcript_22431/m.57083 type:complete len:203 (-) Transcript_22431:439-1047(-)
MFTAYGNQKGAEGAMPRGSGFTRLATPYATPLWMVGVGSSVTRAYTPSSSAVTLGVTANQDWSLPLALMRYRRSLFASVTADTPSTAEDTPVMLAGIFMVQGTMPFLSVRSVTICAAAHVAMTLRLMKGVGAVGGSDLLLTRTSSAPVVALTSASCAPQRATSSPALWRAPSHWNCCPSLVLHTKSLLHRGAVRPASVMLVG